MLKKAMVAATAAGPVVGMSVGAASSAPAIGNDNGPTVTSGTGATSSFGDSATNGDMSPQLSLVQGTLDKPCVGPQDTNVAPLGVVPVQDLDVLADEMNQQCSDSSTQAERDGVPSHVLEDLSFLSTNGDQG